MGIEYILDTVIMLQTNSQPPTGAVLLFPTFSGDKNCFSPSELWPIPVSLTPKPSF